MEDKVYSYSRTVALAKEEYLAVIKKSSKWDEKQMHLIASSDMEEFKRLYYLYEFSDRLSCVFDGITNYPTIFNYVDTGILSMEEAMDALLY